jgi:hypothetical protein
MSIKHITVEELKNAIASCSSFKGVAEKFGLFNSGSNLTRLKEKAEKHNIDFSHFTGQLWSKGKTKIEDKRIKASFSDTNEVFCENSKVPPSTIKELILKKNLVPYVCAICGQEPMWNGRELKLQMDHINGIRNDHRLENLRILCPHCHTQTETYGGKNQKKNKLSIEKVKEAIENTYTVAEAINYLGINNVNRDKIVRIMIENGYKLKKKVKEKKYCLCCNNEIQTRAKKYCSTECSQNNKINSLPENWVHGTTNTYEYRKCRCDLCRAANTESKRKDRLKARQENKEVVE